MKSMSVFKFINPKRNMKMALIISLMAFLIVILYNSLDTELRSGISKLLFGILTLTSVIIYNRKNKIKIGEIIIEEKMFKLYSFNNKKLPVIINEDELIVEIEIDKILFRRRQTKAIIGKVYKKYIEIDSQWDELCNRVSSLR